MKEELQILKEMIEADLGLFKQSLKENPNDEYFKGALQEATDIMYEINKLLED